jgi:hypothetical protein
MWRRCETDDLITIPHALSSSDFRDATTYVPETENYIFPTLNGSGAEDPYLWYDTATDTVHALLHDEQETRCMLPTGCSAAGRHAFSVDHGVHWTYAESDAYGRRVDFTDGTAAELYCRARPSLIFDSAGVNPTHLVTGAQPSNTSDYVYTLIVPLGGV